MTNSKLVIAIGGPAGSGKTTYAKAIARRYGLRYFSAGQVFRRIAKEKGISLEELSKLAEQDPSIDLLIDKTTLEESFKGNVVVEGHLVPWIVKDVADIKIYVTAPLHVRVRRIAEREKRPVTEVLKETVLREHSQRKRFIYFYGIDILDLSIFDLVIDTSKLTIEDVMKIIYVFIETRLPELKKRIINE